MTLTIRPHFWRIMSWTRARDSAIGALVWTATKSLHCSGVTSQNLIGCWRLSRRIVAWPTPALLTRMSIVPKRPRALATISSIASSRARSASIVSKLAPCCRCCAAWASSARPWAVRSTAATPSPLPSRPSTNSRPMPPAAPVTIAARCCSLILSSQPSVCGDTPRPGRVSQPTSRQRRWPFFFVPLPPLATGEGRRGPPNWIAAWPILYLEFGAGFWWGRRCTGSGVGVCVSNVTRSPEPEIVP